MQQRIKDFFSRIKGTPIEFTFRAGILVILAVLLMDVIVFLIKGEIDLEGVLIEAHGMVFDIILFGLILAYYNHRLQKKHDVENKEREKALRIQRYKEEIEDFQGWNEKEAMYKNVGNIRRLNRMGVSKINLQQSYLESGKLDKANLEYADMFMANLNQADLVGASLKHTSLNYAKLKGVNLEGANLQYADLSNARFIVAKLKDSDLRGCKFFDTIFENCILSGAKVDQELWFEELLQKQMNVEVVEKLMQKYKVNKEPQLDEEGNKYFRIERKRRF